MEHEMNEMTGGISEALGVTVERLAAAAGMLEQTIEKLEARQSAMQGEVQRIVATVEQGEPMRSELERKLRDAEQQIAELRAQAGAQSGAQVARTSGRKTLPATTASLLAKQGISTLDSVDAGALDAAMSSLSIEQRIAVKSQLLRAGLLG